MLESNHDGGDTHPDDRASGEADRSGVSAERAARRRTVAVLGATGFVGRHLIRELIERGVHVRVLIRDLAKASTVLPCDSVSMVVGDVFDEGDLDQLFDGAAASVNLIGIRRELPGGITFRRLHVDATRRALCAAQRAGTRRFIQMSALGARPDAAALYHRTKWEAELLVRDSALAWTIFRPSLILGPDGEFMQMAMGWARGTEPPKRFLPYFRRAVASVRELGRESGDLSGAVQPVSVRDVARAFASALEHDQAIGEVYPLVGPEAMNWPRLLVAIRDQTPGANRRLKPLGIPAKPASDVARLFEMLGLGSLLPFGPSEPIMAAEDNIGSCVKARTDLAIDPEPFEKTLAWRSTA